jgi:prepilin-type N-terminal cleavage/methylation domain-containing protein
MKRILQNRQLDHRGFTLVELIVAMTITFIVIAAAASLLLSSTSLLAHQTNKVDRETIADTAADFAKNRLIYAEGVTVVSDISSAPASSAILYIGDADGIPAPKGYLYFKRAGDTGDPINAYGTDFYKRTTIGLEYEETTYADDTKSFAITVNIYVDGNDAVQYSKTKTYQFLNSALPGIDGHLSAKSETTPFYLLIQ